MTRPTLIDLADRLGNYNGPAPYQVMHEVEAALRAMTTPSETRAGKLRDLIGQLVSMAAITDQDAARSVAERIEEALAASEPVEAVVTVEVWEEFAGKSCYKMTQHDGFRSLPNGVHHLYTHPAPEQPGKGEAVAYLVEHDDGWQNVLLAGEVDDRFRDALTAAGRKVTPLGRLTPQPSDPAEGDAHPSNPLLETARRNIRQFLSKASFASDADRWSAGQCIDVIEAALSTPPTAAVSGDISLRQHDDGRWSVRIGNGAIPEMFDTASAALTAALDPQVKR